MFHLILIYQVVFFQQKEYIEIIVKINKIRAYSTGKVVFFFRIPSMQSRIKGSYMEVMVRVVTNGRVPSGHCCLVMGKESFNGLYCYQRSSYLKNILFIH